MGQHVNASVRDLGDAFAAFNQMAEQLSASYRELEGQVARLSGELAAARSERLRQLAEKERLANRLEQLLQALPGGVVVLDGAERVQEANPVACELLGEPLIHQPWSAVTRRAFREGEAEPVLADGRRLSLSSRALLPEPGRIVLLADVTEMRRLQETVSRQKRLTAMGEMAASLAHQIRTPLAAATLYLSHLVRPRLAEADRLRFAQRTQERVAHLEQMVNDMLLFARGGGAGSEPVALPALVEEFVRAAEPQLAAAGGTLRVDAPVPALTLQGNRAALLGALLNLATNALQAGALSLELAVGTDAGGLLLRLRDDGPGMSEAVRERIFEPFFTTRSNGTGLGMAVVRAVAQAHHGEVEVDSAPGTGTTVTVRLPLHGAPRPLPAGADRSALEVGAGMTGEGAA